MVMAGWVSLFQKPRSEAESDVFDKALKSINIWYAHQKTTTWMLTHLPPGTTLQGPSSPHEYQEAFKHGF